MLLNKLITKKVRLQCVYLCLTYHLIRKRVVKVAALRNNMFYLIGRCKKFSKRDSFSRIRRTIFLLKPQLISVQLLSRRLRHLRNLGNFLKILVFPIQFL